MRSVDAYVWDNTHAPGTTAWNPYSYRAAFGADAPLLPISGVAASADTDQTGESVTAWFGDFRLEARP